MHHHRPSHEHVIVSPIGPPASFWLLDSEQEKVRELLTELGRRFQGATRMAGEILPAGPGVRHEFAIPSARLDEAKALISQIVTTLQRPLMVYIGGLAYRFSPGAKRLPDRSLGLLVLVTMPNIREKDRQPHRQGDIDWFIAGLLQASLNREAFLQRRVEGDEYLDQEPHCEPATGYHLCVGRAGHQRLRSHLEHSRTKFEQRLIYESGRIALTVGTGLIK